MLRYVMLRYVIYAVGNQIDEQRLCHIEPDFVFVR